MKNNATNILCRLAQLALGLYAPDGSRKRTATVTNTSTNLA